MTVKCIDISHYQEGFDFEAFAKAGGLAVICKASEGLSMEDPCYAEFRDLAMESELAFASYHFLRPGDMRQQALFYLETAKPRNGERVIADHEDSHVSLGGLIEFLKEIQLLEPTLQLTVYSGHLLKEQLGSHRNTWLAGNTSLWVAQYTSASEPEWPKRTYHTWSLWQYTDEAEVAGFDGPVDGDRFNGSDEQMLKWFGPVEAEPPQTIPTPQAEEMEFEISLSAPIKITVRRTK